MGPKELNAKLEAASETLPGVERKRMPGGYALFAGGKIFANVTLDARIGLKLPVAWCLAELASLPGAAPWKLGQKIMEGWVLIPESFHHDDGALREWVERAHACATGKVPVRRPDILDDPPPPTARSATRPPPPSPAANGSNGASSRKRASQPIPAAPRTAPPALIIDEPETPALPIKLPRSRSSRSLQPAPPSSRDGYDFSHYSAPPPSSLGIRVVPRDSKSQYEETLIGVPAPSSSNIELDDPDSEHVRIDERAGKPKADKK